MKDTKLRFRISLELKVMFELNEHEVAALDALAIYGTDSFLKVFYEKMGKHYLEPHESGLKSLFEKVKELKKPIQELQEYRKKIVKP